MTATFNYDQLTGSKSGALIMASCLDIVAVVLNTADIPSAALDIRDVRDTRNMTTGIILLAKNAPLTMSLIEQSRLARDLIDVREARTDDSYAEARDILQHYWLCAHRAHGNPETYIKKFKPAALRL